MNGLTDVLVAYREAGPPHEMDPIVHSSRGNPIFYKEAFIVALLDDSDESRLVGNELK